MVPIIENSGNWIKFLSTKKHYYNTIIRHCTIIIIKTKKTYKTGETLKSNKCNYELTFSNALCEKVQQ
jgi:hypothetical protein